jgi:hypothetical protein
LQTRKRELIVVVNAQGQTIAQFNAFPRKEVFSLLPHLNYDCVGLRCGDKIHTVEDPPLGAGTYELLLKPTLVEQASTFISSLCPNGKAQLKRSGLISQSKGLNGKDGTAEERKFLLSDSKLD